MGPCEKLIWFCGIFCFAVYCSAHPSPYSKCPEGERIKPCQCEKECDECMAVIACANLTTMETLYDVMTKSDDFPFRVAQFRDSVFAYIPALVFERKEYRILELKNCTFAALLEKPVKGDPPLFLLKLDDVRVQRGAAFDIFSSFKHLRFLVFKNMPIRKISRSMMESLSMTIEELEFHKTSTQRIDSDAFSRFDKLSKIAVSHNNIKNIEASMFPSVVDHLDLKYNKIKTIPAGFTTALPRLFNFELDGNQITTLDQDAIGSFPYNVYLRDNPIVCNCQVKWVVGRKAPNIYGNCTDRDGRSFKELTNEDFNYC